MSISPLISILSLLLLLSISTLFTTAAEDYNGFVYAGCTQPRYDPGSPYESAVESLLTALSNAASTNTYSNFTSPLPSSSSLISGLLQCRSDLPLSYCDSCVRAAVSKLSTLCSLAAGGAVQLRACFIRYGNDSFLGKQDTTLLYKNCGAPAPGGGYNGADLPGMRDAALGALVAAESPSAGGAYRVGGAGYIQAMSQCVGDLSAKECSDCVGASIDQLKSGCSYASAGEVYLGKCYARFWTTNGANSHSSNPYQFSHGGTSGKTLAIIIGLMIGVAIIIVVLSFVRRAGRGKG